MKTVLAVIFVLVVISAVVSYFFKVLPVFSTLNSDVFETLPHKIASLVLSNNVLVVRLSENSVSLHTFDGNELVRLPDRPIDQFLEELQLSPQLPFLVDYSAFACDIDSTAQGKNISAMNYSALLDYYLMLTGEEEKIFSSDINVRLITSEESAINSVLETEKVKLLTKMQQYLHELSNFGANIYLHPTKVLKQLDYSDDSHEKLLNSLSLECADSGSIEVVLVVIGNNEEYVSSDQSNDKIKAMISTTKTEHDSCNNVTIIKISLSNSSQLPLAQMALNIINAVYQSDYANRLKQPFTSKCRVSNTFKSFASNAVTRTNHQLTARNAIAIASKTSLLMGRLHKIIQLDNFFEIMMVTEGMWQRLQRISLLSQELSKIVNFSKLNKGFCCESVCIFKKCVIHQEEHLSKSNNFKKMTGLQENLLFEVESLYNVDSGRLFSSWTWTQQAAAITATYWIPMIVPMCRVARKVLLG